MYITAERKNPISYRPGLDIWTCYKDVWRRHWDDFQKIYNNSFSKRYGPLKPDKKAEAEKLLKCGDFKNGFQKYACEECKTILIVPFSCKSRLCLSCYRKRLFGWSVNLSHIINTSLSHIHVTFTIPGNLSRILFERNFSTESLIKLSAITYQKEMRMQIGDPSCEYSSGIVATVHKSGNGLNFNPHVHLISTRELISRDTGEISRSPFIPYKRFKLIWMNAVMRFLVRREIITKEELEEIKGRYKNGFHVYFQPITGDDNDVLFRTAEYLASGYFHNSQIVKVDHNKKIIWFRYRSWVNRKTGEKSYKIKRMGIYEFMARMLYILPDYHSKIIRYYGIYAQGRREKNLIFETKTWAKGIEQSFEARPEECPRCGSIMKLSVIYASYADYIWGKLWKTHVLYKGYFHPRSRGP